MTYPPPPPILGVCLELDWQNIEAYNPKELAQTWIGVRFMTIDHRIMLCNDPIYAVQEVLDNFFTCGNRILISEVTCYNV